MRYPPEHKHATRERILDAAARLFRRDGFSATGIDAVMAEAGLTAGAFYGHFKSKDELLHASMEHFFATQQGMREQGLDGLVGLEWVEALVDRYLSIEHMSDPEHGCVLPALTPELSRATASVRSVYQEQIVGWAQQLMQLLQVDEPELEQDELRSLALGAIAAMVGGLSIARVMPNSDRAAAMLQGARRLARAAIRSGTGGHAVTSNIARTTGVGAAR